MNHESYRAALIAFYETEGPWFQKIENLRRGEPLTLEDIHVIEGLAAAAEQMPRAA